MLFDLPAGREPASARAISVNGYNEKADDPFVREAQRLNAQDGLHPSDDGYQLWFGSFSCRLGFRGGRMQRM